MTPNPRHRRRFAPLSAAPLALALLLPARSAAATPPPSPGRGPTVAVEDTMRTEVPPVLVNAPRVTLDEILDRVARGEAHRDSLVKDVTCLVAMRVVGHTGEGQKPVLLEETLGQSWQRRPRQTRWLELRHWELHPPKKGGAKIGVRVETGDDMSEEIVNFAFQPRARREFKFRIEGRQLLGDHLIYRIAFEPRSPLALELPGGVVWVDTRDFVIVRQEITFRQSPIPLFVRGIRRVVVERKKVDDVWMLSRLLARVETTLPLPRVGRSFDLGIEFSQYALNTGLPDSLFEQPGRRRQEVAR
jgi:hypothetical protein